MEIPIDAGEVIEALEAELAESRGDLRIARIALRKATAMIDELNKEKSARNAALPLPKPKRQLAAVGGQTPEGLS